MLTQELMLDGVAYELRGRSINGEQFTSTWRCKACDETEGVAILAQELDDAFELARFSLFVHHNTRHVEVSPCPPIPW